MIADITGPYHIGGMGVGLEDDHIVELYVEMKSVYEYANGSLILQELLGSDD